MPPRASAPAASSTASPNPPRILRLGTTVVSNPKRLAHFREQFFLHRNRSQIVLDDRQLAFTDRDVPVAIPLAAIQALILAALLLPRDREPQFIDRWFSPSPSAASTPTAIEWSPVGASNNVLVLNLLTDTPPPGTELGLTFESPLLSPEAETRLEDAFITPFAGTVIRPTPQPGNQTWRLQPGGRKSWRLGFVFPDADTARLALATFHPSNRLVLSPAAQVTPVPIFILRPPTTPVTYAAHLRLAPPSTASPASPAPVGPRFVHSAPTVASKGILLIPAGILFLGLVVAFPIAWFLFDRYAARRHWTTARVLFGLGVGFAILVAIALVLVLGYWSTSRPPPEESGPAPPARESH